MKVYVYIKLLLVAAITATFFWQDLFKLSKDVTLEWVPVSLALIFLAGVAIYRIRKPLNTFLYLSKNKNSYGVIFFVVSLLLYITKSYMSVVFASLLLAYAISFFVASLIAFLTDYRIVKEVFAAFFALPFMFPPLESFSNQRFELKLFSYIFGGLALAILALQVAKTFPARKGATCEFCGSTVKNEPFCLFCGRQLSMPVYKFRKAEILKVIPIIALIFILLYFFVPVADLSENNARVEIYTWMGVKSEPILMVPKEWFLNGSTRLVDYEKQFKEDYALINLYESAGKYASVLFEIAPKEPYVMNLWQLPEWQREIFVENFPITEQVHGKCYVLRKTNETIVVLRSRTLTYLFKQNSAFVSRKVGISVFMNFSNPIGDEEVVETLKTLKEISAFSVKRLDYLRYWTERVFALNQIYLMSKDLFFLAVAVVTLFSVAAFGRGKDHLVEKTVDKLYSLSDEELTLLVTAFNMHVRGFTGKQLYEKLLKHTGKSIRIEDFCTIFAKLENMGFFKRKLVLKGKNLTLVWIPAF
jgi:hypothetical protein